MNDNPQTDRATAADAELEAHLRHLLRREDPPPGLAERILARAARTPGVPAWPARPRGRLRRYSPAFGAAALVAVLGAWLVAGMMQRRAQARQAQAQLRYALHLTAGELSWAERKVGQGWSRPGSRRAGTGKSGERLEDL
jgi:anti-sigma factor RsiW